MREKTHVEKSRKLNKKKLGIIMAIVIAIIAISMTMIFNTKKEKVNIELNPELARTMKYARVENGEEKLKVKNESRAEEDFAFVEFDAFFLKDLDGDGYAEGVRGTCKEVGKEDTLYMELKVLTNGYLKDGKITVNSDNMYLQTAIVKDNEVKNNYIAANTKVIELNQINNGTQKILKGTVRSGDYSTAAGKTAAIGNDTTKYSKVNSVTLTGTHVAQDGTETKIEKTVYFDVDWYGETKTSLYNMNQTKDINGLADTDDLKIQFTVNAREEKQELILSKSYVEGTLPEVNGYAPIKVEVVGANVTYTYDETTRIFTAQKEATVEDGIVKTTIARENTFTVNVTYPKEAYEERNPEEVLEIKVPVKANYEGYNNTNEEFTNPYKSNTAQGTVIVTYRKPAGKVAKFEVKVGKYVTTPYVRYIVTKKKPLRIYNGTVETEKDDKYIVTWTAYTGTEGAVDSLVMKERKNGAAIVSDRFVTTNAKEISMEDITTNIGIYFANPETMLGADGYIKVYNDETDELIETFTKENWGKYNSSNPYKYENSVKHIRIETSATNKETSLTVYNVKELNDEAIVEKFEKEEFDNLQYIKSTIEGYLGDKFVNQDIHSAGYEESLSVAKLSISKNVITTQETENNFKLVIKTETDENSNEEKWVNGAFLLKLPKEILDVNINKVTIDNSDVEITSYEVYEQDGAKFIKILTENEKEASYSITVDANITPDPRIATTNTNIELYASNENMENYYYKGQDQYDINGNLKTTETVNKVNVGLSLVSPQSLLTNQTATNYDKDGSKTIAPQEAIVDKDQRQANVNINILNNYSGTISQVQILGKIPFEGNTYVLNTNELGSNYSTTMTNAGIILPDELKATAKVYYSTNENPTKDLEDSSNGWTTTPEDFSKVKTFLIDLGDHVLARGESQDFYYTINLPQDAQYNEVSYSSHAVYFSLDTENGKYRTQTEPNKLGFRVEREFDVELTKYQEATNKVVPEATYSLQEEGTEETKTRVTDENGTLKLTNLKVDKTYILKEIKTPSEYELNTDTIKFKIYEENNELKVQVLEGTTRNIRIETKQDENSVLKIEVEDREKANLKIVKVEAGTENAIKGVRFKITGTDVTKTVTTNASGEANLKGLKIGEEYTIEEVKAEGYYLNTPITFKITKNGSEYSLDVNGNKVKQNSITKENEIPTINLKIENDKIPTFDLELNKVAKGETTALEGAKFKLYKGQLDKGTFETDENGKIQITGLYQYEEERALDQTYTLKEIKAPDGYAKVKDITFYVEEVEGKLTAKITSGNVKEQTSEGNNVSLTIEDSPSFKLIKKESGTETLLPNCKFAIYNVDDGDENAKPATNSKGEIIGVKETINGEDYYVVTTNDKGELTADLKEGLYKAVEVDAPEQYDITDATYYFAIGDIKAEQNPIVAKWATSYGGTDDDEIKSVAETSDGGIIAGGYFNGTIQVGDITLTSKGYDDGILIKYDNTGKVEWATSYGGTSSDYIYSVAETSDGGVIVGGYFYGTIQVGDITLTSKGGTDGILIKYDNTGKVEWAESYGGTSNDYIYSVAETSDGGIIAGGYFSRTIQVGNMTLTSKGSYDGILIKCDNTGKVEWATSYGGTSYDDIYSVAETSDGGIIAGGDFYGTMQVGDMTLTSKGRCDGILIKYDNTGKVEWAESYGGTSNDGINSVAETSDGGIIAGGYFQGTIQVGNMTLTSKGSYDGILIKCDNTGKVEWATSYGGTSSDSIQSVAETSDGGIIAGGIFNGTIQVGNMTLTSKGSTDGILIKYKPKYKVSEQSELIVKNKLKEFKITTDVKEIDGVKGGNISGEDENPYEKVKYGENSTEEIKLTPDENYEIISITVNGEEYPFTSNEDGTYTMPQFENVTEDIHVEVTYCLKDNKIIINKVDKQTKEKLPNATFKLDQIEEREEPTGVIGELTANGQEYVYLDENNEITDEGVLGELTQNSTSAYYFVKNEDGTLVPTNSKTYQLANGGTAGIGNTTANSYIPIDLSGLQGKYKVVVNARVSSESSYDYGYATITQTTTAPTYSNSTGRFIYISGTTSTYTTSKDYESTTALEGGKTYYLHLGYRKDASADTGEDQIVINSIKVYGITSNTYNFIENNGKYESNNQGKANTTANSYIPIDLRNYTGKYNLTVNAQVSSQLSYDYGYATVTTTTTAPTYSNSSGRFIYISGITGTNVEPNDYTTVLDGGQMYYLHLGYYKNASTNSGLDKFTINSIKLTLNDSELYHTEVTTNSEGQAITQLPFGKYKITEITAPEGYAINDSIPDIEFRADGVHEFEIEDEKLAKITVHHYIKGTTTKVADDETETNEIGKAYTTTPKFDLEKYELEIDKDGEYVLPENAAGEFKAEDQIIIYYYVEKEIPLTVHHYIEGTNDSVPLRDGTLAQDETDSGKEGTTYTTSELSQNELNEKYELVEVAENKNGTYEGSEVIVTYYYRVKNVKVTTKVDGEGGSISGQNDSIYETVEYGENSTKEIIATPEEGYKISSITINGEEIDFTPNPDGTVKLSNFEQMKEDKEVIVSFEKIPTSVIVHHYIYDEETNTYTTIKVDEDKTITGNIDDNYTTSKTNKAQNYTCLNETPENCQGQMEKNTIEVTYYYKLNPSTLENEITKEVKASKTVEKTIEENNTEKTISVEVLTKEDEEVKYTITYKTQITDYIGKAKIVIVDTLPASIDEEKSNLKGGTYNEQNKTITWEEEVQVDTYKNGNYQYNKTKEISLVYKDQDVTKNLENKVSGKSTIYYPENYPNKEGEILESKEKTDDAIVEQEYTKEIKVTKVWDDADNIKNRRPESVTVQLTADGKNVENTSEILNKTNNWTHTYKNLPKYTESGVEINYSVKETETKAKDLEYYEDAKIEGTDNFVITNKYRLMETELESKITKQATEKITSTKDSVKYKIEYNAEVENYIGEALVTIVDTLPYKIDTQKSKLNGGVYNEDAQTITWKQTIDHINTNEDGKYEIDITKEIEVVFIDIDTLSDKIENHVKGTIDLYETEKTNTTEDDAETKIDIKGTVIAKYVEKETGKEIAQSTKVTDKVGKDYKTEQKEINTYEFVEVKGDEEGKIKEGEQEIIYYYTKIPAQVIVKHVDESGRELAKTETIEGKVGESYTTEAKEFDEYELVKEPENKNGKMVKDQITVTYVYKKVPANVIVKYLEKGTQKELAPQVEIKGYAGDGYHTERKAITNYQKATPEPENSEGKMTKETITVIYYYERIPSGTVKVKYVDIDTKEEIVDGNEIKGYVGESYETKERQLPYYTLVEEMRPQNSTGILTQKDETITYYYRKIPFNMSIEKKIKEVTHNGEKLKVQDGKIMKIELASKKIKETNIKVKYSIVVTNTEKLSGKATVIDKIPQYYKVSSENPNYWTVDNKGNLNYETKELQPGERIELEVVLEWKNGEENFGEETNIAVIENTKNVANYEETTLSDNTSSATIMMSINTGAKKATLYVIAAIGILMFTIFNINRRKQSMRRASSKSHKAYRTYKSNTHKGKHMN